MWQRTSGQRCCWWTWSRSEDHHCPLNHPPRSFQQWILKKFLAGNACLRYLLLLFLVSFFFDSYCRFFDNNDFLIDWLIYKRYFNYLWFFYYYCKTMFIIKLVIATKLYTYCCVRSKIMYLNISKIIPTVTLHMCVYGVL